jgi:hypothetical protein
MLNVQSKTYKANCARHWKPFGKLKLTSSELCNRPRTRGVGAGWLWWAQPNQLPPPAIGGRLGLDLVRTRLAAGGKRIRTIDPAPTGGAFEATPFGSGRSSRHPLIEAQSAIVRFGCIVEHTLAFAFSVRFGRRADDSNVR